MARDPREPLIECTWPSECGWMEIMPDGHHKWDSHRLPLLHELKRKAHAIVHGSLSRQRFELEEGQDWALWHDLCKYNPAQLNLSGKLNHAGYLDYWMSWQELGDPDSHSFSGAWMAPEFALASLIAHAEEHHREVLERDLRVTGGTA